jgi:hypothetical protein
MGGDIASSNHQKPPTMKSVPFHFRILMMMIIATGSLDLPDDLFGQCTLCSGSQNVQIGSGMFIYSLVKDGKTVLSERMISSNR